MRPALAGKTTLTHGHFNYALTAGTSIADGVDVVNFTPAPLNVQMYRADLNPVAGGGLAPGQRSDRPAGATGWISLTQADMTVPPIHDQVDAFRVTVPRYTPPGNYLAAIVGSRTGSSSVDGGGVTLQTRVALEVEITVVGRLRTGLLVKAVKSHRSGHAEHFTVDVTNSGNTVVTLSGIVSVHAGGHPQQVPLGPSAIYVIPGGTAQLTGLWTKLPLFGTARVSASVTALVNNDSAGTYKSPTVSLLFIPWLDVSLIGGGLVIVVLALVLTRRRRNAWLARRAEERQVIKDYRAAQAMGES
jgi:hypothetical protein